MILVICPSITLFHTFPLPLNPFFPIIPLLHVFKKQKISMDMWGVNGSMVNLSEMTLETKMTSLLQQPLTTSPQEVVRPCEPLCPP